MVIIINKNFNYVDITFVETADKINLNQQQCRILWLHLNGNSTDMG